MRVSGVRDTWLNSQVIRFSYLLLHLIAF